MSTIKLRDLELGFLFGLWTTALMVATRVFVYGRFYTQIAPGLILRFDSLAVIMLLMVSFLGVIIAQYSMRYLDGESNQDVFFHDLTFTIFSVCFFITASNLIILFLSWIATSSGLHRLLIFYPSRRKAVEAARKKFVVSRLGDLFLLLGIYMTYKSLGSFNLDKLFDLAKSTLTLKQAAELSAGGFCFALGALTKSAQVPFHFWLPETMETPTPVSALMHAGIINAGGYLMIRLSPLLVFSPSANMTLALVGAFTGIYGSLVMVTQNDIKRKLAYSTISQMGLMMFACGIGAYSLALFHIIAHSLYKAHAFLSTGTLIEDSKKITVQLKQLKTFYLCLFVTCGLGAVIVFQQSFNGRYLPIATYVSVLLLGLAQNAETFPPEVKMRVSVLCRIFVTTFLAVLAAVASESIIHSWIANEVPSMLDFTQRMKWNFLACLLGYSIFAVGFYIANGLMNPKTKTQKNLYVYFWHGGYFGIRTTQLIGRFWPV